MMPAMRRTKARMARYWVFDYFCYRGRGQFSPYYSCQGQFREVCSQLLGSPRIFCKIFQYYTCGMTLAKKYSQQLTIKRNLNIFLPIFTTHAHTQIHKISNKIYPSNTKTLGPKQILKNLILIYLNLNIQNIQNLVTSYLSSMDRLKQLSLQVAPINGNLFQHVQMAPPDPILGTALAFQKDTSKDKINLGIGAYRDNDGKPYIFKAVQQAEEVVRKGNFNKEYLPIDGSAPFCVGARRLLLGDSAVVKEGRVATTQTLSGTGALYIGFDFLRHFLPRFIYIPDPTWLNHKNIIEDCGLKWIEYPYFNAKTLGSNIPGMLKFLQNAIAGSVVLLHACAHNPTGVDPTEAEWKQIAAVMKKNSLIPYFDSAYQGFATGDLEKDAWPIRYFIEQGFQMIIAQSFAKNMGLYGERVGALHFVASDKDTCEKVLSQVKIIIRKKYSNPPLHGALVAQTILNDPKLFESWRTELRDIVAQRIIEMRKALRSQLQKLGTPGTWNHITDQIGMFSYTGLSTKQCEILIDKYHIYLLKSGRISMAGVNAKNVKYLAQAIKNSIAEAPVK